MGNSSLSRVNDVYENVRKLEKLGCVDVNVKDGLLVRDVKLEKRLMVGLYKTFYYTDQWDLRMQEKMNDYWYLRKVLRRNVELYNKYNGLDIDVEGYVSGTVDRLRPTLELVFME